MDSFDYIMWMDADNWFDAPQCEDILGTRVGMEHAHIYDNSWSNFYLFM